VIIPTFPQSGNAVSDESSGPETIAKLTGDLVGFVKQSVRDGSSFDAVEKGLLQRVLRIGGVAADLFLQLQGDGDLGETVRSAAGIDLHRSETVHKHELRSIFQEHTFASFVYSRGAKQKIELRPIAARLNLPRRKESYLFQEFTQLFCVEKAFGVGARQFERIFGQKISVAVLEDMNRDMGTQADQFLNEELAKPKAKEEGQLLVLTADAKGVPLVKADAQAVPAFDAKERPGNRRMATLGCAYTVDRFWRTPEELVAALFRDTTETPSPDRRPEACFKRYRGYFAYNPPGEEPIPGAIRTWTWLATETTTRHQSHQPIIRLMDGQPILWESADACLDDFIRERRQAGEVVRIVDILDILHVSSYVWQAAKVFHTLKEHQEAFARDRLLRILNGEVVGVVESLRRMASLNDLSENNLKTVATVCHYFESNASRMRYHEYLQAGYPIATGVIEGACRHVIKDRMEQGGMRWTLAGAEAMLNVRAVNASSEAEAFHNWRQREEETRHHRHRDLTEGYQPLKI
jgi:hypothetical protein